MEEGQEKNKEWENFWWTVDEDMFTYVMKSRIEEIIEEKLNQEFPEEVKTRENQDIESDEEMISETEETDDDSEPVGSPQVPFLMCTLEIPQNLQHKFFALNFCYLYF